MNDTLQPTQCRMPPCGGGHRGFTLVELLVVVVVIATLMALLIPAIWSARAASQRVHCQSNLRSIGQALLAWEAGKGRFPYGRDEQKYYDHSWATVILPQLEEQALYDRYDWTRRWDDDNPPNYDAGEESKPPLAATIPTTDAGSETGDAATGPGDENDSTDRWTNRKIAETNLSVFQCPSIAHPFDGAIDYGGNYGTTLTGLEAGFKKNQAWACGVLLAVNLQRMDAADVRTRGVRGSEISDGGSHTFLVLEDSGRPDDQGGQWANGHNCFAQDRGYINIHRSNEIYSKHHLIAHALMADGSVMVVNEDMDRKVLGALATRSGGETIDFEE